MERWCIALSRESKLLSLLLLIVTLCTCLLPVSAEEAGGAPAAGANVPAGYRLIGSNEKFNLYLHDPDMALVVERIDTGDVLFSTVQGGKTNKNQWNGIQQSGVVIEYLEDVKDKAIQTDFLLNDTEVITYTDIENGVVANVNFVDLGISFDVTVVLDDWGITVSMAEDSIKEVKDETYLIVRNQDGVEEKVYTTKYTKTKEESEIAIIDTDGNRFILNKANYVSDANGVVTVKNADGTKQMAVPLEEGKTGAFNVVVTDSNGTSLEIDPARVKGIEKTLYLTGTAKDGSALRYRKDDVVEISEYSYTISAIYLYPFMGYSEADVGKGYMIIPDGQGAIVGFENNEKRYSTPYDKPVYGLNLGTAGAIVGGDTEAYSEDRVPAEQVIAPFFGMVHTDKEMAVLGVIEEGDVGARIIAYPNGVRNLNYDWVTAKYVYRFVFKQPMGPGAGSVATRNEHRRDFDIKQHFLLTCGEEANYAGLAVAYRGYLNRTGAFANAEKRPFDFQIDILGMERENFILGKTDVEMTTFEQAGEIISGLKEGGVENMSVVYRGWQTDGLTGGVPTDSFSPASSLGGKSGLKELREQLDALGVSLSLEADVLSLNTETHPALTFSAFKRITSETWSRPTFGKVYSTLNYLNPVASRDAALDLVEGMNDAEVKGIAFTGITQLLSDYYHQDKYHDTSEMKAYYEEAIVKANETMAINLIAPNAYLWKYANVLSDLPIAGSYYTYTDAEIPFLTIALSGQIPCYVEYSNFQANTQAFFLHLMEQGVRPTFLLTMEDPIELQNTNSSTIYSSRYDLYKPQIIDWYTKLKELHDKAGEDGVIVGHVRSGDMVCVTWSNGMKVYLNFGDFKGTMDGVELGALEYVIKEVSDSGNAE